MFMKRTKTIVLVATVFSASAVSANAFNDSFYGIGFAGVNQATDNIKGTGNIVDMNTPGKDTDMSYGIGLGYKLTPDVRIEGRLTHRQNDTSETGIGMSPVLGAITATASGEFKSKEIAINAIYDFNNVSDVFTPYVKAGVGYARNNYKASLQSESFAAFGTTGFDYVEGTEKGLSWNVGFGADYKISKGFSAFAEYQYTNLGDVKSGGEGFTTTDWYETDNYKMHEALVGIKVNF